MTLYVIVSPKVEVAIGTFDSKGAAAAYKGRNPQFKTGKIVPLWPESEAAWLHDNAVRRV